MVQLGKISEVMLQFYHIFYGISIVNLVVGGIFGLLWGETSLRGGEDQHIDYGQEG